MRRERWCQSSQLKSFDYVSCCPVQLFHSLGLEIVIHFAGPVEALAGLVRLAVQEE